MPTKMISLKDAAKTGGVTAMTVRNWVNAGKVKGVPGPTGELMVDRASLKAYLSGRPTRDGAKAEKDYHAARLAKVRADEAEGRVVDVDAVRTLWFRKVRAARDRLLDLPAKLSGPLAGMTDLSAIRVYLDTEIRQVLEELTDAPASAAETQDPTAG